jgi:ketosteroid isomerase-like protein
MDPAALARRYYERLDGDDYEQLADLLAPTFVHYRPDQTIEGRERFVRFMREDRPRTETTHEVEAVYTASAGVAVRGQVFRADGSVWFRFVDVFGVVDGALAECRTYTA